MQEEKKRREITLFSMNSENELVLSQGYSQMILSENDTRMLSILIEGLRKESK